MEDKLRKTLERKFALSESDVAMLIARSPIAYKSYNIKKKNGGKRKINQPAKETKMIQRWIVDSIFSHFKVHPCSTAYEKGDSIKGNALTHIDGLYFVKLDFENFFPSILKEDIENYLKDSKIKLNDKDISDLARILCIRDNKKLCLSIGAPSSPKVSNVLLYAFDEEVNNWCTENDIVYTRYADDLTFSTKNKDMYISIEKKVLEISRKIRSPKITLNNSKRLVLSRKDWISITGVNLTSDFKISVGRKRKRYIRSLVHKHKEHGLSDKELEKLIGLISFTEDIEPGFKHKLYRKYGPIEGLK